jgi:hypothetical protein
MFSRSRAFAPWPGLAVPHSRLTIGGTAGSTASGWPERSGCVPITCVSVVPR